MMECPNCFSRDFERIVKCRSCNEVYDIDPLKLLERVRVLEEQVSELYRRVELKDVE